MQRLEIRGAVRPLYGSLGVKGLMINGRITVTKVRYVPRRTVRYHSIHTKAQLTHKDISLEF